MAPSGSHQADAFGGTTGGRLAGLRVERLGSSSVTYGLGLFRNDAAETFSAGRFVHVYVDSRTRRPVALPAGHAAALRTLLVTSPAASG